MWKDVVCLWEDVVGEFDGTFGHWDGLEDSVEDVVGVFGVGTFVMGRVQRKS